MWFQYVNFPYQIFKNMPHSFVTQSKIGKQKLQKEPGNTPLHVLKSPGGWEPLFTWEVISSFHTMQPS